MHMRGRATSAPDVTAPSIHVFAVPTGAGYPRTPPSASPDSTVPNYGTFSQGFDATPSFPPGTAPSHDASAELPAELQDVLSELHLADLAADLAGLRPRIADLVADDAELQPNREP